MLKNIGKRCIVGDYTIGINLADTRDSYVCSNAMGEIGNIMISNQGVCLYPDYESEDKIRHNKERILLEAFKEIFGADEFNPLSSEYYHKIKDMIGSGELSKLGYAIEEDPDYDLFEYPDFGDLDTSTHRRSGR